MSNKVTLTHEEFAEFFAAQYGMPLPVLVKGGMACMPCACGANYCMGWRAYWPKTGREEHGNPQRMLEAIARKQDRMAGRRLS